MSLTRRQDLVRIARRYDALIITDDVYDQLQWPVSPSSTGRSLETAALPRVVDVDRHLDGGADRAGSDAFGNAVSNGSFSKIVGPGCRTGWAEGTKKFAYGLSQVGSSRSGGAPSQLTATFMAELLRSGDLQRHILQALQPAYASRYRKMMAAIQQHLLPLGVTTPQMGTEVVGGYFIWLTLPEPLNARELAAAAKEVENVIIAPGSLFGVDGDSTEDDFERGIRLCFSWEDEEKLGEGVERLARTVRRMQVGGVGRRSRPADLTEGHH